MIRWCFRLLGILSLLAGAASAETVTYIHTDQLGSPVLETSSTGANVRATDYRAYGDELLSGPQLGPAFTGHYRDADTGLVYMQQRYYDPLVGRFLSVDPVETDPKTGEHFARYRYANNNPYGYADRDGRIANFVLGAAVGAIVDVAAQYTLTGEVKMSGVIGAAITGAATSGTSAIYMSAARAGTLTVTQATIRATGAAGVNGAVGSAVESALEGEAPMLEKMALAGVANMLSTGAVSSMTFRPDITPLGSRGSGMSLGYTIKETTEQAAATSSAVVGASSAGVGAAVKNSAFKSMEYGVTTGQKAAEEEIK